MKIIRSFAITSTALGLSATFSEAAITYVDAVSGASGNTFQTSVGDLSDTTWASTTAGTDSANEVWARRTGFANGGTIFEADQRNSTLTIPEITTQVSVANGTYDAWVFFWDAGGTNKWEISAGLATGSLTLYSFDGNGNTTSTVAASTLDFVADPMFTEGTDRVMYGVKLDQITVSDGTLEVFIGEQALSGSGGANRSWYDGIGYQLVPEPSSAALLALSGLALLRRRRN